MADDVRFHFVGISRGQLLLSSVASPYDVCVKESGRSAANQFLEVLRVAGTLDANV